jgi:phosphoglycolate phosphatase
MPGQKMFQCLAVWGKRRAQGKRSNAMRTAVFDLDGTLADTSADLIAGANAALEAAGWGRTLDPKADASVAFRGGRAMLAAGLGRQDAANVDTGAEIERLFPVLLEEYRRVIDVETRLYDGVEEALDILDADGWSLAVCTNKPVALADLLLDRLGLAPRFRAVLGADSLDVRKPDPRHLLETISRAGGRREAAVLVGDTVTDRDAARAAQVPCILVSFGPDGTGVQALEPEALLAHYRDLGPLLDRLVPAGGAGA